MICVFSARFTNQTRYTNRKNQKKRVKFIRIGISSVQLTSWFHWKVMKFESHLMSNLILSVCSWPVWFNPWKFLKFNFFFSLFHPFGWPYLLLRWTTSSRSMYKKYWRPFLTFRVTLYKVFLECWPPFGTDCSSLHVILWEFKVRFTNFSLCKPACGTDQVRKAGDHCICIQLLLPFVFFFLPWPFTDLALSTGEEIRSLPCKIDRMNC